MKFTYPAIIRKQDNGTWKAWLPDLACCEAVGDTLDDAIEEVNAAVYDWISLELSEDEADLPPVSDMDDLDTIEGDVTRNICVNIRLSRSCYICTKKLRKLVKSVNIRKENVKTCYGL